MRGTPAIVFGLAMVFTASAANAAITPYWRAVNITATTDALTPAPGLEGFQSWDLMISLTPGDDFTSFRLFWDPVGVIFHHALGGGEPDFGPPDSMLIPAFPVLEFDSYLRGPGGTMAVLGATDGTNDLPPPGIFNEDVLSIAAGDLTIDTQGGDFQLLRVTLGPGGFGSGIGRVFSAQNPFGVPIIVPEPGAAATIAPLALLWLRRRRRASA